MRYQPGIADKYIIKKFLGTFFYSILIVLAIVGVIDFSEKIDNFLEFKLSFGYVMTEYYINFFQYYGNMLAPIMVFIAVIFFTSKMANNTEIVPMLSGGYSYNRFLYPYFLCSLFLGLSLFLLNAYVIPNSNKTRLAFEEQYINRTKDYTTNNYHIQLDNQTYIYLESFDYLSNTGYKFSIEKFEDKNLKYKLLANRIQWDSLKKNWTIYNYSVRTINGLHETLSSGLKIDTNMDFKPTDFQQKPNIMETMTLPELNRYITKQTSRGSTEVEAYLMERQKRFAAPFTIFILVFMGVNISSRKVRGGIGGQLGLGILMSFGYVLMLQFTNVFATKGGMPPIIAAWIPNLLFIGYGYRLYLKAPK